MVRSGVFGIQIGIWLLFLRFLLVTLDVVSGIVWDLLGHAFDKDEGVRLGIGRSLQTLGNSQPELVLSASAEFIRRMSAKGTVAHAHDD